MPHTDKKPRLIYQRGCKNYLFSESWDMLYEDYSSVLAEKNEFTRLPKPDKLLISNF